MSDLIERLEAATGPLFVLDEEIHALLPVPKLIIPPAYTASIDAALTLVPEGWEGVSLDQGWRCDKGPGGASAYLAEKQYGDCLRTRAEHDSSMPLAICIAALKAREASDG